MNKFKNFNLLMGFLALILSINQKCSANYIKIKTDVKNYGIASVHLFCNEQGYQNHIWGTDDLKYEKCQKQALQKLNNRSIKDGNLIYCFIVQAAKHIRNIEDKIETYYDQIRCGKIDYLTAEKLMESLYQQKYFYEKSILNYLMIK